MLNTVKKSIGTFNHSEKITRQALFLLNLLAWKVSFLYTVDAITNEQGKIVTRMYFGAFGQKHEIAKGNWSATSQSIAATTLVNLGDVTTRGYTGHEHLDSFNLIHMNGWVGTWPKT